MYFTLTAHSGIYSGFSPRKNLILFDICELQVISLGSCNHTLIACELSSQMDSERITQGYLELTQPYKVWRHLSLNGLIPIKFVYLYTTLQVIPV